MEPRKYGRVIYLDLSDPQECQAAAGGIPYQINRLTTLHLAGVSNNRDNHFNGLPIVHVFPANVGTANIPPSLQHTASGAGLAQPYESGQEELVERFRQNSKSFRDRGIMDPHIVVIGFPTVSFEPHIRLEIPAVAKDVFNHFIAGMYFQLARANLCIPVNDGDLDKFQMPDRAHEDFVGVTFPQGRRAAFGGGVGQDFLPSYGAWFHTELFYMDVFVNELANATTREEQDTIIHELPPQFEAAFRQGVVSSREFYGPFNPRPFAPQHSPQFGFQLSAQSPSPAPKQRRRSFEFLPPPESITITYDMDVVPGRDSDFIDSPAMRRP